MRKLLLGGILHSVIFICCSEPKTLISWVDCNWLLNFYVRYNVQKLNDLLQVETVVASSQLLSFVLFISHA